MNRYYKLFFAFICLSLLISNLTAQQRQRGPSREEIAKMEEAMPNKAIVEPNKPRKLLVFNLCQGYRHSSIPYWDKALQIMAQKTGAFSVVISSDMDVFKADSLKEFDAVCFNNTTNLPFSPEKTPDLCKSLMDFVKGGKGIIGIHAATDNFNQWPEAQEMMGGKFTGHPWTANGQGEALHGIKPAFSGWAIKIDEPNHPLMASFAGKGFKIKDEIYRTDPPLYSRDKQLVLMSLDMNDEVTREKAEKPTDADTGISWVKSWGKGRLFYCSLGHNHHVTWNPSVLEHYLRGIQFAMGDLKVKTKPKPQTNG
jgi:type 1 glutamine amidotransferase